MEKQSEYDGIKNTQKTAYSMSSAHPKSYMCRRKGKC